MGEIQKERLVLLLFDPADGFACVASCDVVPALYRFNHNVLIAANWYSQFCVVDPNGESVELGRAVEVIEALSIRHGGWISAGWQVFAILGQVPFCR